MARIRDRRNNIESEKDIKKECVCVCVCECECVRG